MLQEGGGRQTRDYECNYRHFPVKPDACFDYSVSPTLLMLPQGATIEQKNPGSTNIYPRLTMNRATLFVALVTFASSNAISVLP